MINGFSPGVYDNLTFLNLHLRSWDSNIYKWMSSLLCSGWLKLM